MNTGERIKQLRISLGMSQEELGEKVGVKKAAIHKYESGIVVNLKRSIIDELANALNSTPAYLMGWDEIETKEGSWTIQELSEFPSSDSSIPMELKRGVFANNISKYMLKHNVSQKDICNLLGVDSSVVSQWLNGDELPDIKTIEALADFLQVQRNNLLSAKNTRYYDRKEKKEAPAEKLGELWEYLVKELGREPNDTDVQFLKDAAKILPKEIKK